MSVLPVSKVGRVEFCENHIAPWTTNAVAIGTSAGAVTDLQTKTEAARAAYQAQQAAQDAAKDATVDFNLAVVAMTNAAADIIKQVKAKAAISGDGVYALASIPVPATPSPVPRPGTPEAFTAQLLPDGSLALAWKCPNPTGSAGTIYHVARRIGLSGEFVFIGATGPRKWVDATVPANSGPVTYQITALRSTASGVAAQFIVNFGGGGGGEMTASVVADGGGSPTPRMAA